MNQAPAAAGQMLLATDMFIGPFYEIVVVATEQDAMTEHILRRLHQSYLPRSVLAVREVSQPFHAEHPLASLFGDRPAIQDQTTVYVCEDTTCWEPAVGQAALKQIDRLAKATATPQG